MCIRSDWRCVDNITVFAVIRDCDDNFVLYEKETNLPRTNSHWSQPMDRSGTTSSSSILRRSGSCASCPRILTATTPTPTPVVMRSLLRAQLFRFCLVCLCLSFAPIPPLSLSLSLFFLLQIYIYICIYVVHTLAIMYLSLSLCSATTTRHNLCRTRGFSLTRQSSLVTAHTQRIQQRWLRRIEENCVVCLCSRSLSPARRARTASSERARERERTSAAAAARQQRRAAERARALSESLLLLLLSSCFVVVVSSRCCCAASSSYGWCTCRMRSSRKQQYKHTFPDNSVDDCTAGARERRKQLSSNV